MNPTDALPPGIVFAQPLTPVAHSLLLSFLVAVIPIAVALIALGVLRRPRGRRRSPSRASRSRSAHGACRRRIQRGRRRHGARGRAGDVDRLQRAAAVQHRGEVGPLRPVPAVDARQPARRSPPRAARRRVLVRLPARRDLGIRHAGRDHERTLDRARLPALEALTYTLLFNTAPVAFGALGVPITVLGAVTSLPPATLAQMVGRQLPFFALLLPFYVVGAYGGLRSISKLARAARVGRQLRDRAVRHVELPRLPAHRRAVVAHVADRHDRFPADVEAAARSAIRARAQRAGNGRRARAASAAGCRGSSCRWS